MRMENCKTMILRLIDMQIQILLHINAIASGSTDTKTIGVIKNQKRSVIGVKMEAFAVQIAVTLSGITLTKTLRLKLVYDLC
jgi:hypothetical protein